MKKTCSMLFKVLAFYPILAMLGYAFGFGTFGGGPEGGMILGTSEYWISMLPSFYDAVAQFIVLFGIGLALSKTSKIKGIWGCICYVAALLYFGYYVYQAILLIPQFHEQAAAYGIEPIYFYLNTFLLQMAQNIFIILALFAVGKLVRVGHRQANEDLQFAYESSYEPECACGCGECDKEAGCTEDDCTECDHEESCGCGCEECDEADGACDCGCEETEEACDCGCEEAAEEAETADQADAE